jgi:4-hydroxy-tetrahydrodipicolinate synthase
MKIPELKGCGTALLTPFLEDGEVDYEAFAALVQRQAEGGVDFLVPLGTTAETPTLDPVERVSLLEIAHDCAGGRPLLVGCGSNSVAGTLAQMNMLDGAAVDAWLVVVPFYNKPNQEGQYQESQYELVSVVALLRPCVSSRHMSRVLLCHVPRAPVCQVP